MKYRNEKQRALVINSVMALLQLHRNMSVETINLIVAHYLALVQSPETPHEEKPLVDN